MSVVSFVSVVVNFRAGSYYIHSPPVDSNQSAIFLTAAGMSLSEISNSRRGKMDSPTSRFTNSCSRIKTDKSLYWSGFPETLSLSALAAANEPGVRLRKTRRKLSGKRRSSSQRKS